MAIGKKVNITHLTAKNKVRMMRPKSFLTKGGKTKIKLVPAIPSPKKNFVPASAGANALPVQDDDESDVEMGVYVPFQPGLPEESVQRSKDSNDYMAEWIPKEMAYLDQIMAREAPPSPVTCSNCGTLSASSWWRCKDCVGAPVFCPSCCRNIHLSNPLHRVETLRDAYFSSNWLSNCGVHVELCSEGRCKAVDDVDMDLEVDAGEVEPEYGERSDSFWTQGDFDSRPKPSKRYLNGMKVLVVVHTNGVHSLPFHFCNCIDCADDEYQLLSMGFYPATCKDIRTVFTFALLDEYLLEALECYTSTHHYYAKIRRLTNKAFPDAVPDRLRELRRVGRQWRRLKELASHGFAHNGRIPEQGSMALFCAACPQPGINLPADWKDDKEQWKYTRSFVADGNFTCVHRKQREHGDPEIRLKDGESFMTNSEEYKEHLETGMETNETPTCHEHRAIADKSKFRKGLDVTGIGAVACMRHGAFAPGSVVDFQKGERQINMDYALSEALKHSHTEGIKRILFAYDVNCQYSKHLLERLEKGEYLHLSEDFVWVFAIGLFHVHAHQESCTPRYSLTFIEGAGNSSGEILESLWAMVNEVARATSTMSLAHRAEVLDAVFADINWKKMLTSVASIGKNWLKSRREMALAKEDLALLSESATANQISKWQKQLDEAQEKRISDVTAMDILIPKIVKPPTQAKVRTRLMEKEKKLGRGVGVTSWLSFALKIQESQISLKSYVRGLPKKRSDQQELEVARRREDLYTQIGSLYETASHLFPDADLGTLKLDEPPADDVVVDDDDVEDEEDNPFSLTQNEMEDVKLPLPSSLSTTSDASSMDQAREKELKLRIAQADDALENIRTEIGHKSYLYRSNVRLADGKKQKTRGYAAVKQVNKSLRDHIKVYNHARWAMRRLGADDATQSRYKAIKQEDIKAVTTIYKPNARGIRNKPLPWIWNLDVAGDSQRSEYLEELYRVNWLRAKCRYDRWKEEHVLLTCEMDWVLNFFAFKQDEWKALALLKRESPGHLAYARREAETWRLLYTQAEKVFTKTRNSVKDK